MLYQVDTGQGLMRIKYINADNETEATEKAKDILFDEVTTSNCCGAESNDWHEFNGVKEGFCADCGEHCEFETNDKAIERVESDE